MAGDENEGLFRQQAIRSLSDRRPGYPICGAPRPWRWLVALVTSLFLSAAFIICTAEYARTETVRGWLVSKSGVARIASLVPAVVAGIPKRAGDRIAVGEPLIYLSTDTVHADGSSESEQILAELRQEALEIDIQLDMSLQQQLLDRASLQQQLKEMDLEVASIEDRLLVQQHQARLSDNKLRQLESLKSRDLVADRDVIRQAENHNLSLQELSRLKQVAANLQRERSSLARRWSNLPAQGEIQRSTLRARKSQLTRQTAEHESTRLAVVKSPVKGVIAAVEVDIGNAVAPQQLLMNVVPEDLKLAAEIYVPSRAAGFVQAGQSVQITYDAFPQQKFGTFDGRVDRISDFVLLPGEIPQTFALHEASYKVHIEIDDVAIATSIGVIGLRPGMLLAAEIVLEQRNLLDWLLEPLRYSRSSSA
jgi:membrane fusion protein